MGSFQLIFVRLEDKVSKIYRTEESCWNIHNEPPPSVPTIKYNFITPQIGPWLRTHKTDVLLMLWLTIDDYQSPAHTSVIWMFHYFLRDFFAANEAIPRPIILSHVIWWLLGKKAKRIKKTENCLSRDCVNISDRNGEVLYHQQWIKDKPSDNKAPNNCRRMRWINNQHKKKRDFDCDEAQRGIS